MPWVIRIAVSLSWQVPFFLVTDFGFFDWQTWLMAAGVLGSQFLRVKLEEFYDKNGYKDSWFGPGSFRDTRLPGTKGAPPPYPRPAPPERSFWLMAAKEQIEREEAAIDRRLRGIRIALDGPTEEIK